MIKKLLVFLFFSVCLFPIHVVCEYIPPETGKEIARGTFYQLGKVDKTFLSLVRTQLSSSGDEKSIHAKLMEEGKAIGLPTNINGVAVVLYQPGKPRIMVVRRDPNLFSALSKAIAGVRKHKRYSTFNVANKDLCRVQIDLFTSKPEPFNINAAHMFKFDSNRFEFGVDGLVVNVKGGKDTVYFLPGDAFIRSRLGFRQLDRNLRSQLKIEKSIELSYKKLSTFSFVSFQDNWLELYRGYPFPWELSSTDILDAGIRGAQHILQNQGKEGKFLYYYNAAKDSMLDHEHPNRTPGKDGYYNIVRHLAAINTLFKEYERTKNKQILVGIEKGLWFAASFSQKYPLPNGKTAAQIYQYGKSKLGATGVFLYAMTKYQAISGSKRFDDLIEQIARHLEAEILPSGEFRYYAIYKDKVVPAEKNSEFFDFYYPGEALLGLSSYIHSPQGDKALAASIRKNIHRALSFLIVERPRKYQGQFPSLPMDAWVAMAINELWQDPEYQKFEYSDFVFKTADQVLSQMYTVKNGNYLDFPGAYFYSYGDHAYPDGSRAEGVMAALSLAKRVGDKARTATYTDALQLTIRSLYFLVNTDRSVYAVPNRQKSIGGIRFKLTRQWFRIDTIAHVANVFYDFAPMWSQSTDAQNVKSIIQNIGFPNK